MIVVYKVQWPAMRFLWLSFFFFLHRTGIAQDCDPLALMNRPAQQVKLPDIDTRHAFATDLPAARKVVTYIDKIFELAYKPKGVKVERFANYHNSNKYQGENRKINSKIHSSNYGYDIYNYNYYCSNGKFATQGETSLRLYLRINSGLNQIPNDTVPILDDDGSLYAHQPLGFYDLEHWVSNKKLPTLTGSYYTYTYEQGGRRNTVWVITRNGKLPFQYVTRRAFLQKRINISKATIKEFKNQATHPKVMESYKEIAAYETDLKKPNDWLNQISIVRREYDKDYYRYVFTTLETTGNPQPQVPVQPDYNYFDKSLPAAAPQYIVITYANSGNNPEAVTFKKSIEDNLELFVKLVNSQHSSPAQNNGVRTADVRTITSKVPEDKTVIQAISAESIAKNKDPYTFLFEDFQQVPDGGHPPGWITNSTLPRPSIHQLERASGNWLLIPAAKTLSQQNASALPEKFSIEYDLLFTNTEASHYNYYTLIVSADKHNSKQVLNATNQPVISGQSEFRLLINMDKRKEKFWIEHSRDKMSDDGRVQTGKMNFPVTTRDKPVRVSITVNGRSLKAKLNEQTLIDDPQYLPEGIRFKKYAFAVSGSKEGYGIYLSNLHIRSAMPIKN